VAPVGLEERLQRLGAVSVVAHGGIVECVK
jgi:hypothetical protein